MTSTPTEREATPSLAGSATATTQSSSRIEDAALLTGQGRFLDDLDPLAGTLVATIVRSPHPHARIRSVALDEARKHPGVVAVIGPDEVATGLDALPLSIGTATTYYPAAVGKTRYVGEPVAVIVATDRYVAEDAADLVRVDYDPLEPVVEIAAAMECDAALVHEDAGSNTVSDRLFSFGDPGHVFDAAPNQFEATYSFPRYSSTPMECYSVIADWQESPTGPQVTVWANFHGPFSMVPVVAKCLGIPIDSLRLVVPPDIGGSFGIKAAVYPYMALIALASRHAGQPVRWTEDRIEHLLASSAGSDRVMTVKSAYDDDGIILGIDVDLIDNVGSYLRPPEPSTLYRCFGNITGPYAIKHVRIRARAIVSNKAPTGLNRGFGGQQLYFGIERMIDEVAVALGMDPAEIRMKNFVPDDNFPHETPTGGLYDSGSYRKAFRLALNQAGYEELRQRQDAARLAGHRVGIGISTIVDPSGTNIGYVGLATPASDRDPKRAKSGSTELVRISVDPQGTVSVLLGTVPQGQGHATVARDVVAERLGVPVEMVRPRVEMDTDSTPWTISSGSYSSRFAPLLTSALVAAADKIAATIKRAGAIILDENPANLEIVDGEVRSAVNPDNRVAFRHAAGLVHWDPGALAADGEVRLYEAAAFVPPEATAPSDSDKVNSSLCYGFVADVVAVRVDTDTLQVEIEHLSTVHDAGTILNHQLLEGQVHGAIAHALGGAFYEELAYSASGQPIAGTFMDYLCPTASELNFKLTSGYIESPSPHTALGAKGCGEGSAMSLPVALANAVADALRDDGVKVRSLPLHGNVLHDLLDPPRKKV